jgi:hypothetical protein
MDNSTTFLATLNFRAERLALLLCIRKVPGWNLDSKTGYVGWGFWWFSSVSTSKFRDSTSNYAITASFQIFLIHYSWIILQFDVKIVWAIKSYIK